MTSLRVTQVGEYETIEIPLNIGNVLALADAKPVKPKCTCPKKNGRQAPCKGKQKPDYNEDDKRILKASADCRPKRPRDDRCAYDKYPHLKECHEKKLCSHIKCSCSTCENGRAKKTVDYKVHPIRPWYPVDNRPLITSVAITKPTVDINDLELC